MPFLPPNARQEPLTDYARRCSPVIWREQRIKAADGTEIALCIGSTTPSRGKQDRNPINKKHVVILYFQGNASSLPPRLPYLSDTLKSLGRDPAQGQFHVEYSIVGVSYRGFWTSKGRPSQRGIVLDVAAALGWVTSSYASGSEDVQLVLWGQSIGAGIACSAAVAYLRTASPNIQGSTKVRPKIAGLLLETPFTSIRSMLVTIYPQKWLPYRYLWPFLRNWWDSKAALRGIALESVERRPRVLILQAGQDELVPREHGFELEALCKEIGITVERKEITGALHTEVMARSEGQAAVVSYLRHIVDE
ncbi:MAG: hypothetical protein M1812_003457 [Candelaria pacifica]|nr:MAG: hypothetical protein M1812_003457 [Candelaria pacifica]